MHENNEQYDLPPTENINRNTPQVAQPPKLPKPSGSGTPKPPQQKKPEVPKKRRRRGKKKTHREKGVLKIMYNNINGQSRNLWDEIESRTREQGADIICLTETHWKEGDKGQEVKGYRRYWRRRAPEEKKGGGVAIFVKNDLSAWEWERQSESRSNEHIWIVVQGQSEEIAIGVVYMGIDKYKGWNDKMEQALTEDLAQLEAEGKTIILLGDFNAHITEKDGGVPNQDKKTKTNTNGGRLTRLMDEHGLEMMNKSTKCRGKWTRMTETSKSIIDYVLISDQHQEVPRSMTINDTGTGLAGTSDHNWIDLELNLTQRQDSHGIKKPQTIRGWNIHRKTDWVSYKEKIEQYLEPWNNELEQLRGDTTATDTAYEKLVEVMKRAGEEAVGRKKDRKDPKPNRRLQKEIKKRNSTGRSWRRACKENEPNTLRLWRDYLGKKAKVNKLKKEGRNKRKNKWVEEALKEQGGIGQKIWEKIGPDKDLRGIEALDDDGTRITENLDTATAV